MEQDACDLVALCYREKGWIGCHARRKSVHPIPLHSQEQGRPLSCHTCLSRLPRLRGGLFAGELSSGLTWGACGCGRTWSSQDPRALGNHPSPNLLERLLSESAHTLLLFVGEKYHLLRRKPDILQLSLCKVGGEISQQGFARAHVRV